MLSQEVKNYDPTFQEFILKNIVNDPEIFIRCKNILKPEYFDKVYAKSVQFIIDYSDKYNTLPPLSEITVETNVTFLPEVVDKVHHQGHLDRIESFCRHKALENAIAEGMRCVQERKYGMLESLVKDAMQVSLQKDLGSCYFEDPEERIRRIFEQQGTISTGWADVDRRLFGGFGPGEIELFLAPSGHGKSLAMQNLAVNFSSRMMNGVYISLELSEDLVNNRIDCMMLDRSKNSIKMNIETAAAEIKVLEKKRGSFYVKRMPESSTTVNDIRAYLKEYLTKTNQEIHYLCVDYLDLLSTPKVLDSANTFMKDKFVSEELRALANEFNIVLITASQINRSGIDTDAFSQSNISGGISKIHTSDNVIAIRNTDAFRARGEILFEFIKTRNSNGGNVKLAFNVDTMRIGDHQDSINTPMHTNVSTPQSLSAAIKAQQTAVMATASDTFEDDSQPEVLNTQNTAPKKVDTGVNALMNIIKNQNRMSSGI